MKEIHRDRLQRMADGDTLSREDDLVAMGCSAYAALEEIGKLAELAHPTVRIVSPEERMADALERIADRLAPAPTKSEKDLRNAMSSVMNQMMGDE